MASAFIPKAYRARQRRVSSREWVVTLRGNVISSAKPFGSAKATAKKWNALIRRLGADNPQSLSVLIDAITDLVNGATNPATSFLPPWTTGP